ncbi:MAG: regulatory protein RecX [Planctomycetota bacterium]
MLRRRDADDFVMPEAGMVVTSLRRRQRGTQIVVAISLEGSAAGSADVADLPSLAKGDALDDETAERVAHAIAIYRATIDAERLLRAGPKTSSMLERRLRQRGAEDAVASEVCARLRDLGYLNDERLAEGLAETLTRRGYTGRAVTMRLRAKGVDQRSAEAATTAAIAQTDTAELARELAEKKARQTKHVQDARKRRKRIIDALLRRGFDLDDAMRAADDALRPA